MKDITLAVKEVVLFLYASGNLSSEFIKQSSELEGQKAHSYLQGLYKNDDIKEYYVKNSFLINSYNVTIHGFIDGVLSSNILEEIKSTFLPLDVIERDNRPEHLAQLKMYAYLYCIEKKISEIDIRLTYIKIPDYLTKSFDLHLNIAELENFFFTSLKEYISWIKMLDEHSKSLLEACKEMTFPFSNYRLGQKKFMKECYYAVINNDLLYAIAPTGIGKTISAIYSTLKALSNNKQKIFYLTAKTSGKKIAKETAELLIKQNVPLKAIELTAKEKSCFLDEQNCDPTICPYAKDFFSKLKKATYDIYSSYNMFDFETIRKVAYNNIICPFEFSLYLSYYSDIIIGDYNYAFDPKTHLIRYFDTNDYEHILLIDEAHNLVNRSKEMYSSTVTLSNLIEYRRVLAKLKPSIRKDIKELLDFISSYDNNYYYQDELPSSLLNIIRKIISKSEDTFTDNQNYDFKEILQSYFDLKQFIKISEYYSNDFRFVIDNDTINIKCLNASKYILQTAKNNAISAVFFSATLYPLDYYKTLITNKVGNEVIIPSPFDNNNLKIIIKRNANTKFNKRSASVDDIIETINLMISYKVGNYIVFFPSYEYLNMVVSSLDNPDYYYIVQTPNMSEDERIAIIEEFSSHDYTKVGFFVMGGAFSEGIDYYGEMLSGVMIVSVCLPMVGKYNNMLKDYFDETFENGFLYAYMIPGMAKVIQSVGRVIRSENDKGIAILYDERFSYSDYRNLMPNSWENVSTVYNDIDLLRVIKKTKK